MKILKNYRIILFLCLVLVLRLILAPAVLAVCPICTVAVGAGLGLSRYLGIDDAVSSIWIGGLTLSMSFWLIDWLKMRFQSKFKSKKNSYLLHLVTIFVMYFLVLYPLTLTDIIGHPFNTILGIDKILFGTMIGSLVFLFGIWADKKVRKVKGGQLFSYQKVVFPVSALVIASLLIYYFGGYLY